MDTSEIEYINALAPFDHGVWTGRSTAGEMISVGEQALFRSRSEWLVDRIVSYLIDEFSLESLKKMDVLEVGSYDGWVLTQVCKRIEFSQVTGVEPRLKNIKKGEVGRKLANIQTQARFVQGSADNLEELFPDRDFDIVICLGMLHHVSSTYDTIATLCAKSSDVTIIDSMIVPELTGDKSALEPFVNTRDIVYHGEENIWAIAAFKYESPYGDGSRPNFGIVNVPSASLIKMSLRSCGFGSVISLGDEADFFDDSGQKLRGVKELLAVSRREFSSSDVDARWKEKVSNSESIFCHTTLPDQLILSLSNIVQEFKSLDIYSDVCDVISLSNGADIDAVMSSVIASGMTEDIKTNLKSNINDITDSHFQILSILFRSPFEKIILEISKFFIKNDSPDSAIKYLKLIVRKPGCDWWSFYRSCYLLSESFEKKDDNKNAGHYRDLLQLSNENFPF